MSSVLESIADFEEVKSCKTPETKPNPQSHDSAEEFSLARLARVHELLKFDSEELDRSVFNDLLFHIR